MKSIYIGNIKIDNPIMLAPMAGVSDPPFKEIINSFGSVGLMFSEMIPSKSLFFGNKDKSINKTKKIFDINAVQISGNDPYYMAEAAKINVDLGADIIDINFGCPVKKVVKGFAGSAIMKDEKLAEEIMKSVANAVNVPVSMKMRMGWDFENLNAPTIAKIAEDVGIKMITLHCRTRSQMYNGSADWQFAEKVKTCIKNIPFIVNGDIKDSTSLEKSLLLSKADGAMIGRGIYGKPWLFKEITDENFKKPTMLELQDIILRHFDLAINYYGKQESCSLFKKHLGWYSNGIKNSSEFRNKVNKINNHDNIVEEIKNFFK